MPVGGTVLSIQQRGPESTAPAVEWLATGHVIGHVSHVAGMSPPVDAEPVRVVAFGSCRKQKFKQPIWAAVERLRPDLFAWLGDYVYCSKRIKHLTELESCYASAAASEGGLRGAARVIEGVWDDHDYGENDAGYRWPHRDYVRQLFLDKVVRAPADSPRRTQAGGLYGVRAFGQPPRQVKLLMLDTRYSRADHFIPSIGGSSWLPKPGIIAGLIRAACATLGMGREYAGDILGSEEQWQWLEAELTNSTAAVHLIVSSVQVLTSNPVVESWGHYPRSRVRLLKLLAATRPAGALLLSGDVHFAEFLGRQPLLDPLLPAAAGVMEVTSSGLTHSCGDGAIGRVLCGTVLRLFDGHRYAHAGSAVAPSATGNSTRLAQFASPGGSLAAVNFGSIEFDWGGESATAPAAGPGASHMLVRVHDVTGAVRLQHAIPLELGPRLEAARWNLALAMPTIFDGAVVLRVPLAAALLLVGLVLVMILKVKAATARAARRGRGRGRAGTSQARKSQ